MSLSLNRRLLLAASIVLIAFLGITGLVLQRAFRHNAEQAEYDRLQGKVIALVAALELNDKGNIYLANALAESRFFTEQSGLYGQAVRNDGTDAWYSPSLAGQHLPSAVLRRGQQRQTQARLPSGMPVFIYSLGIGWSDDTPAQQAYTFSVAENRQALDRQLADFQKLLWGWLTAVALLLLLVQGTILRWGLTPLRRVAAELMRIQSGQQQGLQYAYPRELRGLTDNLNSLLQTQQRQMQRYRETLGDLAHSLKTPLALLRGSIEARDAGIPVAQRRPLQEQLDHMSQVIDYQLQRASAAGRTALLTPVAVAAQIDKVLSALDKVYFDKGIAAENLVAPEVRVQIDRQDLLELLGNLLDNAYKYGRYHVTITADYADTGPEGGRQFQLCVEDDGPGIDATLQDSVLRRGVRGDSSDVPVHGAAATGQGIGLAIVQDIVATYGGRLTIATGRWHGAEVCICLPLVDDVP